jgi:hypothetical protein
MSVSFQHFLGLDFPKGKLPDLKDIWSLHDFEAAARNFLNGTAYSWIRTGVGAEYSYRNKLYVFRKVGFKPRMLKGPASGKSLLNTTIGRVSEGVERRHADPVVQHHHSRP